MSDLKLAVAAASRGNPAKFTEIVENELRQRIVKRIMQQKPRIFKEAARQGESSFRAAHGVEVHDHPVAGRDNFRSGATKAHRLADRDTQGMEEHGEPDSSVMLAKNLSMKGTGFNAGDQDDEMSMSAHEFIEFINSAEHEGQFESLRHFRNAQRELMESNDYDRRIARQKLREMVDIAAKVYGKHRGGHVSSPTKAEVVRHILTRMERV